MNDRTAGYDGLVKETAGGIKTLSLLIGGVHCAVCIQKIESSLSADEHVTKARLNFSTRRLEIQWQGDADEANRFVPKIESLGYSVTPFNASLEKTTGEREERFLLLCLGVAGFAMGNIMLLSVGLWATTTETMGGATRDLLHWISALIALPTVLFSGRPFFRSAYTALSNKHTNMDVPISLALILACGMSLFELLESGEHVYFDSAVMLTFFLLIGRYLDARTRAAAKSAATDLMQTLSGFANVIDGTQQKRILISDIRPGMRLSVAAGEEFPVDGLIESGQTSIDTSLVTGETLPRTIQENDPVYAGTLNLSTPVIIKVEKAAEESLLADIVRLMEQSTQGQARYVRLADRAAKLYTPVVHFLAFAAFFLWWGVYGTDWQDSLMIAVTVLIITCPCALGLAVPVVQVLATGRLLKQGVLVKSGDALERLAKIDTILFDKTGTLTLGTPQLIGTYPPKYIERAASLASHSAHPLSKALTAAYDGEFLSLKDIKEHSGQGLSATDQNQTIKLGSRAYCGDPHAPASDTLELWLNIDGAPAACFQFEDQLRTDTRQTLQSLQQESIITMLLSGDRSHIAYKIAAACGIDKEYAHGDLTPPDKHKMLQDFKRDGKTVLMVGDGLNDAPALAAADISMAPGSAIDMAQNAADIVFMGERLAPVYNTYTTARLTQKLVKQNFALAAAYNVIFIPLAFMGLVTPMMAALAMSCSSLLVSANAFRLRL